MIYFDPPYGIKYNSNWQMRLNDRNVGIPGFSASRYATADAMEQRPFQAGR
jgi:hypothetical protein